jgi:hypothetical protein
VRLREVRCGLCWLILRGPGADVKRFVPLSRRLRGTGCDDYNHVGRVYPLVVQFVIVEDKRAVVIQLVILLSP